MLYGVCLIRSPVITDDFTKLRSIGRGSQGTVDLYQRLSK